MLNFKFESMKKLLKISLLKLEKESLLDQEMRCLKGGFDDWHVDAIMLMVVDRLSELMIPLILRIIFIHMEAPLNLVHVQEILTMQPKVNS